VAASPALRAVLYGVDPIAPATFSVVLVTLLCTGLAAASIAALPVRRVNPVEALKAE
jgi:ABC-type antimicrobial peptide transport system permease subunit